MEVKAKDLRTETRRILETVERGEDVIISYRGKPRARVTALRGGTGNRGLENSPLFGMWSDHDRLADVNDYIDQLRESRH